MLGRVWTGIFLLATLPQVACAAEPLNRRVLVVYDNKTRDSQTIAKYYAKARDIPDRNLCTLSLSDPAAKTLSIGEYEKNVRKPVEQCLERVGKETILYIVLAYVRPYIIVVQNKVNHYAMDAYLADIWDFYSSKDWDPMPARPHPYYASNRAKDNVFLPFVSLAQFRSAADAPIIYSVWRLDGATPAIAGSLVDKAIGAEKHHGPAGEACIDELVDPLTSPDMGYRAGGLGSFPGGADAFRGGIQGVGG